MRVPRTPANGVGTDGASACLADDADPNELEPLITDAVPVGFRQLPDDVGDTGPSDVAKAIRDDSAEDAERVLRELRFRRGYQRLWQDDAGHRLIVFIYEFCDPAGARGYIDRVVEFFRESGSPMEEFPSDITAVDVGFRVEDEGVGFVSIPTSSDNYAIQVVANGETGTTSWDTYYEWAADLLQSQLEAL